MSAAIQAWVESHGLQVVREYTGHGVGHDMHEDPEIFNWGTPGTGHVLKPGMTYALEPMVTVGPPALVVRGDGWTVATIDGGLCAHFEHAHRHHRRRGRDPHPVGHDMDTMLTYFDCN